MLIDVIYRCFFPFECKLENRVSTILALHTVSDVHSFLQQLFTACLPFNAVG